MISVKIIQFDSFGCIRVLVRYSLQFFILYITKHFWGVFSYVLHCTCVFHCVFNCVFHFVFYCVFNCVFNGVFHYVFNCVFHCFHLCFSVVFFIVFSIN